MTISDAPTQTLPTEGEVGFVDIGSLTTESGAVIDDVCIAVQRWGQLSPARDNVVVVLHALTAIPTSPGLRDPGIQRPAGGTGWPARARRSTPTAGAGGTNVLGGCRGSTGPSSLARDGKPWGSRFPLITVRDQVEADIAALAALGITEVAAVVGGSMGGARALEWMVSYPDRVRAGLLLAVGARATADQIGTQSTQIAASRPTRMAGRRLPRHWSHTGCRADNRAPLRPSDLRGEVELDSRFANDGQRDEDPAKGGRYAVQSYLEHQGDKLLARFDAGSYVVLTETLSSHDVAAAAVEYAEHCALPGTAVVGGITSDRLYPLRLQEELAELLPGCAGLQVVDSICGHDGFLVESEAVGELIRSTLDLAEGEGARLRCPR